jgi:hypothetical protein
MIRNRHAERMASVADFNVSKIMDAESHVTSRDVIIRPPSKDGDEIIISPDEIKMNMNGGVGGIDMSSVRTRIKKTGEVDFEDDFRAFNMNGKQFDGAMDKSPSSVINARPLIAEQLFPPELKKLAGLVKQLKSFLGQG